MVNPSVGRRLVIIAVAVIMMMASGATLSAGAAPSQPYVPKIIGGTAASTDEFPWVVALADPDRINRPSGFFCGGTLVAPDKMITAAHCVYGYQGAPTAVRAIGGRTDLRFDDGVVRRAAQIWVHPDFDPMSLAADVAVVTLASALPYRPLPLGTFTGDDPYRPGLPATILGWGAEAVDDQGGRALRQAHPPLVDDATCAAAHPGEEWFPPYDPDTHVCAGYAAGTTNIATGDSGGPLVVDGRLVGVTSTRNLSQPEEPALFTRLASYADEITDQLG